MEPTKNHSNNSKQHDPIAVLEAAFLARKERNAQYSLRSFARDLGISVAQISKILNRKTHLSRKQAAKVAVELCLSKKQTQSLIEQVILGAPSNAKINKKLKEKTKLRSIQEVNPSFQMTNYAVERFKAISQWYHLPLLELTYLDSFQADEAWIAAQLGISRIEVKDAIQRLLDLGLLELCPLKGLKKSVNRLLIDSHSEPEVRKYERAMIDKAVVRLEKFKESDKELQLINSATFPVSKKKIPEVRGAIFEFHKKILRLIKDENYDEVYQLNCQLFPVTRLDKE